MKLFNKNVDERQEIESLRIGNFSYWLLFCVLSLSFIIQIMFFDITMAHILPEMICLVIGSAAMIGGYIAKGQWGIGNKPSIKMNFVTSLITALLYIIVTITRAYFTTENISILPFYLLIRAISVFATVFILLGISGFVAKKRNTKLTKQYDNID